MSQDLRLQTESVQNLIFSKIQDLTLSYILIIDESESSVDNIFLKNEINKSIKEMAEIIPVVISAHNKFHGARLCDIY